MMARASVLFLATVLATVAATTGCTMSASARRNTMLVGAATAIGGVLVVRAGANDSDRNGVNDIYLNDHVGLYVVGSALVVTGVAAVLGALASREPSEPPSTVAYEPPVVASVWELPPEPEAVEPEARTVTIERLPMVPLPDLPATADVLRLGRQVRSASAHSRCDAAWLMWIDLEKLDATYARALRDGPVMARCAM